jgi:phosphoglycolate phosphatase
VPLNSFPQPNVRSVIVDLDGTMVDTLGDFVVALNHMLRQFALPAIAREDVARMVGKGSGHLIRSALSQVDAPDGLYESALAAYQQHYGAVNGHHSTVYAGVEDGLKALRANGLALACLTNKPTNFARALLEMKGLAGYFQLILGGDLFERMKPDPLPIMKTCEALGSTPAQTLVIGDSVNDARAARAAGCPVVLVTYGYNHGEPVRAVDADAFVDSLADVQLLLKRG